jgi:hypothetical protein
MFEATVAEYGKCERSGRTRERSMSDQPRRDPEGMKPPLFPTLAFLLVQSVVIVGLFELMWRYWFNPGLLGSLLISAVLYACGTRAWARYWRRR